MTAFSTLSKGGPSGQFTSLKQTHLLANVYELKNRKVDKFQNTYSGRLYRKAKERETTSSFWGDDFSFNNRTVESKGSLERNSSAPVKKRVMLSRQKTGLIGQHKQIHHGTLDMTLNELKNIFKLRYEHKDDPPIDDVIFQLGINEH